MNNTLETSVWPVNENGEIIMTPGIGSTTITGFLPLNMIPVDGESNHLKAVMSPFATQSVEQGNSLTYYLKEGDIVKFTGNSANATITKFKSDGTVDFTQSVSGSAEYSYGTFTGTQKFLVIVTSGSVSLSQTPAANNSPQLAANSAGFIFPTGNVGVPAHVSHGRTIFVSAQQSNSKPSAIQDAHDALKLAGGGHIILEAGKTYTPTTTVSLDASYVGLCMNGARIDIAGIGNGNYWLNVYGSSDIHDQVGAVNREISGGWIRSSTGGSSGVSAIRIHSPVVNQSSRLVFRNMRIGEVYKAISYKNGGYFTAWYDSFFHDSTIALNQEAGATDFAEGITFYYCVFAENDTHIQDLGGNIFKFFGGSFDYHGSRCFDLRQGSCVVNFGSHFEWSYGATAGQTNSPIKLQDSNTSWFAYGCAMIINNAVQNPYYTAVVEVNNGAQIVDVQFNKVQKIGRLVDGTAVDSFVYATNLSQPYIRTRFESQTGLKTDVPGMSFYCNNNAGDGIGGQIRYGQSNIFNELTHRMALNGTATAVAVTADENGVVRKGGAAMLKLSPGATPAGASIVLTFPITELRRRHAWQFFTNEAFLTGTVTIKESYTSFAPKFNGTTVTMTADGRGKLYGTTVTITGTGSGVSAWNRRSWKDTASSNNTGWRPPQQNALSSVVVIEIDLSGVTAGSLYLTWPAFDIL